MSDHVARMTAEWSPGRAVTPGVATTAERARGMTKDESEAYGEVLDAAFSARLVPEPAKADAPRKGSKAWAIQEACRIVGIAFHGIADYDEASDCFCSESRDQDYRNGGHALAFVEAAVREKLAREKAPAPAAEAKGEMTEQGLRIALEPFYRQGVYVGLAEMQGNAELALAHASRSSEALRPVLAAWAALRARASEAEERAERAERNYKAARDCEEKRGNEWSRHALKVTRERDEAREQRDDLSRENKGLRDQRDAISDQREDLANEILVERAARIRAEAEREAYKQDRDLTAHRLAAAEAEVRRLRLAYDDPSLDATDGAHPAWWRGNDAGVAGAVRIVNEALDEALPLAGCVGGADLERVRQRIAALRERVARLVEAGDGLRYRGTDPVAGAAWAAAKSDAPAAKETKL